MSGTTKDAPPLKTEADWIRAGEIVFDAPIVYNLNPGITPLEDLRDPDWYRATRAPLTKYGRLSFYSYVIQNKGQVELGSGSCAMCHTRIMPDGTIIKGAQGSFPFDTAVMFNFRKERFSVQDIHGFERGTFAAPWLRPDPHTLLYPYVGRRDCCYTRGNSARRDGATPLEPVLFAPYT